MSAGGHPLPASFEARHGEIPEQLERDKGQGDDGADQVAPAEPAVTPDGEPYRYDDLGRGQEQAASRPRSTGHQEKDPAHER